MEPMQADLQLVTRTHDLTLSPKPSGSDTRDDNPAPASPPVAIASMAAAAQPILEIATPPVMSWTLGAEPGGGWPTSEILFPATEGRGTSLSDLPNEVLLHVLGFLDVSDLLATSRSSHHLRSLSLTPILHAYRLRRTREILPPLLTSPRRPSLADLISRSIFMTHTSVVSRRLGRSLIAIRLQRRLAVRPSAEALVERCVLPRECVPGMTVVPVAPGLVAKRRAIERERLKDGLRRWVGAVWKGEVRQRGEGVRRWEERSGVGRVWRLKKFWERVGHGDTLARGT